jgi:hypothetical protein
MKKLEDESDIATGDSVHCEKCQAVLSCVSSITQQEQTTIWVWLVLHTFTFLLLILGLHDLSEVLDGLLTVGGAVTGLSLRRNDPLKDRHNEDNIPLL